MKAVGIILAGGKNERLGELTVNRATSALPIGSCYRTIDFPLSNMSNSGINKVAVITQYNSRSLHDHLSSAKWWDFGSKQGGLFIFTPYLSNDGGFWFRGTADSIYQNLSFLRRSNEPYVVIASGDCVYKMDYNDVLKYHIQKDAEITIVYKDIAGIDLDPKDYGVMRLDEDGRMFDFEEKPIEPQSSLCSLGIYIVPRILLIKLLETILPEARYDIVEDILIRFRKKLRIYGYKFNGYWSSINSISAYYKTNMDFLRRKVRDIFLHDMPYIETKPKDEPPVKYNIGAEAKNCLIGSGSIINGYASGSILFRRVYTGESSSIVNSILMEGCFIGNNCVVENAILDKEVILSDGKNLIGTQNNPLIIRKSTLI